jgi:amino acid transporter
MAGLRRELGAAEAMALSVALMAPTLSASLNGPGTAAIAGAATPLVLIVSTIGVGLVAYAFVKLTRKHNHAGSSYAFVGMTIGPRTGFFAGFALLGVYLAFCGSTMTATVIFCTDFLNRIGIDVGGWGWIPIAILAAVVGYLLCNREVKLIARILLWIEFISIGLIVILSVWILVRLSTGSAPSALPDAGLSATPFLPGSGGLGPIAAATVLGFFCFAGFEASASLGEETSNPRKLIPLAIGAAVVIGGVLFVLAFYAQTVAYGVSDAGVKAYIDSGAPLDKLGEVFIGGWVSALLNFGAFMSAFGCFLGSVTAAARLSFALSRDGFGPKKLARLSPSGAPSMAIIVSVLVGLVAVAVLHGIARADINNVYFYCGTVGSLLILVAYALTSAAAIVMVVRDAQQGRWAQSAVLAVGVVFIAYVLYKSCVPVPDFPANLFPYIAGGWLLIGLIAIVASPALAARIGQNLAEAERRDEAPVPTESG